MITLQIDYRNMQFMVYQDGHLQHNPLPVEVQRSVIEQVIHDCSESICRQLNEQLATDPEALRRSALH